MTKIGLGVTGTVANAGTGKLLWYRWSHGEARGIKLAVYVGDKTYARHLRRLGAASVRVSNVQVPIIFKIGSLPVVYRYPVELKEEDSQLSVDNVFAILTGVKESSFAGNKGDYRDLTRTAQGMGDFLYVLPVTSVSEEEYWTGYVRVGRRRWIGLPCPRPLAIYNRITLRNLERSREAIASRARIRELGIPMFNPEYFDKVKIHKQVN